MKTSTIAIAAFAAVIAPIFALAADTSMPAVGAGPNGYDWFAGTWTCTNTMAPSKLGALPSTTLTATKLKDGSIFFHTTSPNGDVTFYYTYLPKTNEWFSPFSDSGGYYGYESTRQSGKTIHFTGMFYEPSGAVVPIRDTFTMITMRKQLDVSEAKAGGAWKTTARTTCTKS